MILYQREKNYFNSEREIRNIAVNLTTYLKNRVTIDWINQEQVKAEIRMSLPTLID
jgi:hypothetical protein